MPIVSKCLSAMLAFWLVTSLSTVEAGAKTVAGLEAASPVTMPIYRIADMTVTVPTDLRVSEADSYVPLADIVWHGDPAGDRRDQVGKIFREATVLAVADQPTGQDALLEITVSRFHCLTNKARYTVGGLHAIHFDLTLRDPTSGAILYGPEHVIADLRAPNGARALTEELEQGRSQRAVIVAWLSHVIRRQIALPGVVTAAR